jgi:hypothetical protein
MLFIRTLSTLLFFVGLIGLPEDINSWYEVVQRTTEPQFIRNIILASAVLLFFADKVIEHLPVVKKLAGKVQILLFCLKQISKIVWSSP